MSIKSGRIDSTAFRRGVRAFKTGVSNPYNGPELRDEWEAGRAHAKYKHALAANVPRPRKYSEDFNEDLAFKTGFAEGYRTAITKVTGVKYEL